MTEPTLRLLFVLGAVVIVASLAFIGSRRHLARPEKTVRTDLAPGVHLFSSESCLSCSKARRVLDRTVPAYSEIRFEDDPSGFARFAIAQVPTVIVVKEMGEAVVFAGIPKKRDLRRVVSGA